MQLTREFCAENMTLVPAAVAAGTRRIELCDNLAVGGTTPSYGVLRAAAAFADEQGVAVMAIARPRGGNFLYDADERRMMRDDVVCARSLGVAGVVFGCLRKAEGKPVTLDEELLKELVDLAKGTGSGLAAGTPPVQVTFHMAFDELGSDQQLDAVDVLSGLGVERVLTHGGPLGTPIMGNAERLRQLVAYAGSRLTILPGGGVTWENAESVASAIDVCEVHGTKVVALAPDPLV